MVIANGFSHYEAAIKATVAERVRAVIAHQRWGIPINSLLADDEKLASDLGMDVVGAVELALDLEQVFGIELEEGDLMSTATVGALIKLIEARVRLPREPRPQ